MDSNKYRIQVPFGTTGKEYFDTVSWILYGWFLTGIVVLTVHLLVFGGLYLFYGLEAIPEFGKFRYPDHLRDSFIQFSIVSVIIIYILKLFAQHVNVVGLLMLFIAGSFSVTAGVLWFYALFQWILYPFIFYIFVYYSILSWIIFKDYMAIKRNNDI